VEKYGPKGFTVIAVNDWDESKEQIQAFVTKEKLKHTVLLGGMDVSERLYGVPGSPTAFWIDREGRVLHRQVGFSSHHVGAMEKRIEAMLAAKK
jgi:hypothetical protein